MATYNGTSSSDYLSAGKENDSLYGGKGDDALYGGKGDDALYGGKGVDYISGGSGTDTAHFDSTRSEFSVTLSGGSFLLNPLTSNASSLDGFDEISTDVEYLKFSDGTLRLSDQTFTPNTSASSFTLSDLQSGLQNTTIQLVDVHHEGADTYALHLRNVSSMNYRQDPDGVKSSLADLYLSKINSAGQIVSDIKLDSVFSASGYTAASRGTLNVSTSGQISVFMTEKTASNDYGQNGYQYTGDASALYKSTLFQNANWGWNPYFDNSGNVNHFSYAGYYKMIGTSNLGYVDPGTFVDAADTIRIGNSGLSGDVTSWANLIERLTNDILGLNGSTPVNLPSLVIAPSNAPVAEGNSGATPYTFIITRSGDLSAASSATWAVSGNGTNPANGSDFVGGTLPVGTVSFASGQSTATVTVNVNGDTTFEADEGFIVTLSNPQGAVLGASTVATTLNKSVSGGYGVTENVFQLAGGGGAFSLDYEMYSIPDRADIYVNGVLAASTNSAVSYAGTLTATNSFKAGDVVKVIMTGTDVNTAWDYTVNYQGGVQSLDYITSAIILNDDTATPVNLPSLVIAPSNAPVAEGNAGATPYTFTVTRSGDLSASSSATWAVSGNGTNPANGSDFVGGTLPVGTVSFASGQSTATVTVNVNGDTTFEADEGFIVTLSNPQGAVLGASTVATTLNKSVSGGYGVTENVFQLAGGGGAFSLDYEMYSIPDRADIYVNGVLAASTNGAVSYAGTLTASNSFKAGDVVKVIMTGTDVNTAWDYTVNYQGGVQSLDYITSAIVVNDDTSTTPIIPPTTQSKDAQYLVLQPSSPSIVGAGVGDDTYLISGSMITPGKSLTISDANGANSIQLASGLSITSSQVTSNALKMTLSNGAAVTVLGANAFTYDVGANTTAGLNKTDVSFSTFVTGTLGTNIPTTGVSTGGSLVINSAAPASLLASTTSGNDFVTPQYASPSIVGAGTGNDTYLISSAMLPAGTSLTISDANGSNSIQLAPGLSIASSQVAATALKLTLNTGATVTVLGANAFTYDVGGNTTAGIDQADVSFATLVQNTLGTIIPTSGTITGGAVVIGGGSGLTGIPVQGNNTINATAANDVFSFDAVTALLDVAGSNTQATINGFSTSADKLQINLPSANASITTLNQLNGQQGIAVQSDTINNRTLINFGADANGGEAVSLSLTGVTNPALVSVQVSGGATTGGGGAGSILIQGSANVAGTAANDVFFLDVVTALLDSGKTNTQATITGFSTSADKLQINLSSANAAITTLSQLNGQQGVTVQENPIDGSTLIYFGNDSNGGEPVIITLAGITDSALVSIQVI